MKILLVEDNATVRKLVRQVLNEADARIVECTDGADAVEAFATHRPDLVLMDIRMPRMDGLTATRQLKKQFPDARILMLTDCDEDDLRAAAKGGRGVRLCVEELPLLQAVTRSAITDGSE